MSPSVAGVHVKLYVQRFGLLAVLAATAGAGCGVRDRQVLVGHYVAPATGESWTLEEDGSCRIERSGGALACEWVYQRLEGGGTRLVVTVRGAPGLPETHSRKYMLTPSKWPGQPVTIPLSSSATLEKRR